MLLERRKEQDPTARLLVAVDSEGNDDSLERLSLFGRPEGAGARRELQAGCGGDGGAEGRRDEGGAAGLLGAADVRLPCGLRRAKEGVVTVLRELLAACKGLL